MNTCRLLHLDSVNVKTGDKLKYKQLLGLQGNTGTSTGKHLHIDCVKGLHDYYTLSDIDNWIVESDKNILDKFKHYDLFQNNFYMTTDYLEDGYKELYGYNHWGYDFVCTTDEIYFPFDTGEVVNTGYSATAGNYIVIQFDFHWCEDIFNELNDKITIHEKRFDDNITRAEIFALLNRII